MDKSTILESEIALRLLDSAIAIKPVSGNFDWMVKYSNRYNLLSNECRRMINDGKDCKLHKSKVVSVGTIQFIPKSIDRHV